jgi:hypothetical protein
MNILNQEIDEKGIIRITTDKNLFEVTLDDKLELSRTLRASWYGGTYCNKITTLMFKKRKQISD